MKRSLLFYAWIYTASSHAAHITNGIQGVGPNGITRPYLCVQNADGIESHENCVFPSTKFMTYIQQNAVLGNMAGFVGWTIWGAGHAWGDHPLRFTPDFDQMKKIRPFISNK